MNCPSCKDKIEKGTITCPFCGSKIKNGSALGWISLSISIVAVIIILLHSSSIISGIFNYRNIQYIQFIFLIASIFSTASIFLGCIVYFGKNKDTCAVIAVILSICILTLSLAIFIHSEIDALTPDIEFRSVIDHYTKENTIVFESISSNRRIKWDDVEIIGSYDTKPTGSLDIRDNIITGCSGTIIIRYIPTDTQLYEKIFY